MLKGDVNIPTNHRHVCMFSKLSDRCIPSCQCDYLDASSVLVHLRLVHLLQSSFDMHHCVSLISFLFHCISLISVSFASLRIRHITFVFCHRPCRLPLWLNTHLLDHLANRFHHRLLISDWLPSQTGTGSSMLTCFIFCFIVNFTIFTLGL